MLEEKDTIHSEQNDNSDGMKEEPEKRSEATSENPSMESIKNFGQNLGRNLGQNFNQMKESDFFNYCKKRLKNTAPKQEDDDFKSSVIILGTYAVLYIISAFLLAKKLMGAITYSSLKNSAFGGISASRINEQLSMISGEGLAVFRGITFLPLIGIILALVVTILLVSYYDKSLSPREILIAQANRSILSVAFLFVGFVSGLLLGSFTIATSIPFYLIAISALMQQVSSLMIAVEETKALDSNKKYYVFVVCATIYTILYFLISKSYLSNAFKGIY